MRNINIDRLLIVIVMAILFVTFGWTIPALYASNAPESNFIVVHGFSAQNTTTSSDAHIMCFNRTVKQPAAVDVFTELYLVRDDGSRVEVRTESNEAYLQEGTIVVKQRADLPKQMQPGTYRYLLIMKADLADGRVVRTFVYTSEPFEITEGPPVPANPDHISC